MRTDLDLGTGKANITNFWYGDKVGNQRLNCLDPVDPITLYVQIKANESLQNPCFGYMLKNSNGLCVFSIESDSLLLSQESLPRLDSASYYLLSITFQLPPLKSGDYTVDLALADGLGVNHKQCHWTYDSHILSVVNPSLSNGCVGSSATVFSLASISASSPAPPS
jgi:lipopolysaccharide transport system ATP-binding protein